MSRLTDWLLAQIAEDERIAQSSGFTHLTGSDIDLDPAGPSLTLWPGRVLAECEAKRRIIEEHNDSTFRQCGGCEDGVACYLLRLLALPYADRSGYREEWKP